MFETNIGVLLSPLFLAPLFLSAILCFLEYKCGKKPLLIAANGLTTLAAFGVTLYLSGGLCELLLCLLVILFIRLCFALLEGRGKK